MLSIDSAESPSMKKSFMRHIAESMQRSSAGCRSVGRSVFVIVSSSLTAFSYACRAL
jgi:hypothetical protein